MKYAPRRLCLAVLLVMGGAFAACGTGGGSGISVGPAGSGLDASSFAGGDGGKSTVLGGGPDGSSSALGALAITPQAPALTVTTGKPLPTQQFTATIGGAATDGVGWSIDRGELGSIDASGKFTPAGTLGGVGNITATTGTQTATTTITVNVQTIQLGDPAWTATPGDAGAGGYGGVGGSGPGAPPSPTQTQTLSGNPGTDSFVSILYPYDGTVWPQGLLPPLLQWHPGARAFDSLYLHIHENNYDYKGYFAAGSLGPFVNMPIPAQAWSTMAYSNGGEPVTISLVFGEGANAFGPYTETWTIAQATLQGKIYYNSYGTELVLNSDGLDSYGDEYGAGTMAILPGATAPTLVAGIDSPFVTGASTNGNGCRVCHTVAANGQALLTQANAGSPIDYHESMSVDLASDWTSGAGTPLATPDLTYPALYKDGSLLLAGAGGMIYSGGGVEQSGLYALPSGTPVPATGLPPGFQAALPAFSPDGAHLAFNFWAGTFTNGGGAPFSGDTMSLAVLDFDGKSAFSNPRLLYTPAPGTAVAYSSFFPNGAGVVFEVELSNPSKSWGYTWQGNTSELWWVDVATSRAHRLDALNGYEADGVTPYLPGSSTFDDAGTPLHTPSLDTTLNYEATVNPIASGGYAWVVFTSRRMYGNVAQLAPWVSDPRDYPWRDQITDKKLWVAAVDLNGTPGTDTSHPAFYLPAQELHAGNARGYWTVEPCRGNGQSCVTGDQCCGGFCQPSEGGLECTAQAPACAAEYEKCTTTSDCCGAAAGIQCVNSVCTQSAPK